MSQRVRPEVAGPMTGSAKSGAAFARFPGYVSLHPGYKNARPTRYRYLVGNPGGAGGLPIDASSGFFNRLERRPSGRGGGADGWGA